MNAPGVIQVADRLATRDLAIGYGKTEIGENINVGVRPGQILCLLGPNGCGKTTLFRTMLGLLAPLRGEVELNGQPLKALSRPEIARQIAYVPQAHAPHFPYQVLDIVLMGRAARLGLFARPGERDRVAAYSALKSLGIEQLALRDYSRLSGGQRQLVLIARALAQETPFIILDEPTASLDFGNQAVVLGEIRKLFRNKDKREVQVDLQIDASSAQGIILSTHDPDQAFLLGADVALMKDGAMVKAGPVAETLTSELLSHVYGVSIKVEETSSGRRTCSFNLQE